MKKTLNTANGGIRSLRALKALPGPLPDMPQSRLALIEKVMTNRLLLRQSTGGDLGRSGGPLVLVHREHIL